MTSPVETRAADASQRIAMTSPVETRDVDGERTMQFVMPSEYALADLPVPDDPRVRLSERPGEVVAALRFSGRLSPEDAERMRAEALRAVRDAGLEVVGDARIARYDPPWTLGFLRRNEILVPIAEG